MTNHKVANQNKLNLTKVYLAEDDIKPTLVCSIGDDDQYREEEESENSFPNLNFVLVNSLTSIQMYSVPWR